MNARASDLRVGAQVRDQDGAVLGTIQSSNATGAVVARLGYLERGRLPLAAFGRNNRGLVVSRARLFAALSDGTSGQAPRTPASFIVYFDNDRDVITPAAAAILDNAVAAWRRLGNASARVIVAGHTDSRASDAYNAALSQRMADNVRTYLVGHGIPGGVIATEAFGESRPLVETIDGVRELQNRRVEVRFGPGASPAATATASPSPARVERSVILNNRCAERIGIRILYYNRTGALSWAGPANQQGYLWTLQPRSTTTIAYSDGGAPIIATSSEMYVHVTGQNGQAWQLAGAVSRDYGGVSFPFFRVTASVTANGQWEVRFCNA